MWVAEWLAHNQLTIPTPILRHRNRAAAYAAMGNHLRWLANPKRGPFADLAVLYAAADMFASAGKAHPAVDLVLTINGRTFRVRKEG